MDIPAIITDLQTTLEDAVSFPIPPPFREEQSLDERFNITYRELQRRTKSKNRIMSLVNAFYLGKILDEINNRTTRYRYIHQLTTHFYKISSNTYELFKDFPERIGQTTTISVQMIRKLKRPELEQIQEEMVEFLIGARNLEEEIC